MKKRIRKILAALLTFTLMFSLVNLTVAAADSDPTVVYDVSTQKFSFKNANEYKMKDSNLSLNLGAGVRLVKHLEIGFNYNIALGKTGEFNVVAGAKNLVGNGKANSWQISAAYYF